jgi:serine/threonine-protein kinase
MNGVAPSLAGTTIGRYRLIEKLGQGAMATVYRALDPQLGREVAIKVMHPFMAERSDMSTRFEREARAVAGLRHPNVLGLYDYAEATAEHPAYLVMELLTGPSLHRFLVEHGAPLAEVAAMIGVKLAQALSAAHAQGIVHRDVKPENCMFDVRGASLVRVMLCDFGIARVAAAEGMTATGAIIGSPAYMSPEQASGRECDVRSDQFSLGALLYQVATGALPFTAPTPLATMSKIVSGEHRSPTAKNPRVPLYLERVIERCLMLKAESRFPAAEGIAEALREGLNGDGFVDIDGELSRYVRDPAGYNATAGPRIIAAALAQAERATKAGQRARALAAASRVLAWDPKHPRALALADAAAPIRARRILVALAPVLLLASAGAWWLRFQREPVSSRLPVTLRPAQPATSPSPSLEPAPTVPPTTAKVLPPVSMSPLPPLDDKAHPTTALDDKAHPTTALDDKAHAIRPHRHAQAVAVATSAQPVPQGPSPAPPESTAPVAATHAEPARDAPATLTVAIAPWCDLAIDGKPRGRSPQSVTLPGGQHHLECKNPVSGQALVRDLVLAPGESRALREQLYSTVRVTAVLRRGDALTVDGDAPGAGPRQVVPGRRRVTLLSAGKELETRYVDVPPAGCRLVDMPELRCEKP